jgi:predicted TIM-barrel fold metal-dependent hydrolase
MSISNYLASQSQFILFNGIKNQSSPSPTEVAKSFGPIINHAIDVFGDDRCLFGSNYPIDKLILSTLIEAYQMIFENLADNK